jgi:hypothetical protein
MSELDEALPATYSLQPHPIVEIHNRWTDDHADRQTRW